MTEANDIRSNIGVEYAFRYFRAYNNLETADEAKTALELLVSRFSPEDLFGEDTHIQPADMVAMLEEAKQRLSGQVIPEGNDHCITEWEFRPSGEIALVQNEYDLDSLTDEDLEDAWDSFDAAVFPTDILSTTTLCVIK